MKIKKTYKFICNKSNKTLYDQLYIKTYDREANKVLKDYFNNIQDKRIYYFDIYLLENSIIITYSYKGYDVYFEIYRDKYISYIDAPKKYDFIDEREVFEKEEINNISIDSFSSFEDFFNELYKNIIVLNKKIDIFNKSIKFDALTNGKTLNKIEEYKYFCKHISLIYIIGGLVFLAIWTILFIVGLKDIKLNEVLMLLIILCFILLGIFIILIGFNYLVKIINIRKDLKIKKVCKIKGTITKMYFATESYNRSSYNCLEAIILKIKTDNGQMKKIICPIGHCYIKWKLNRKQIKYKYLGKNIEVLYLEKSKICLNGLSNMVSTVIKLINKSKK